MSRSTRKTPIFGNAKASEKLCKRRCNKRARKAWLTPREALSVWAMAKDGRRYFADAAPVDMRK